MLPIDWLVLALLAGLVALAIWHDDQFPEVPSPLDLLRRVRAWWDARGR